MGGRKLNLGCGGDYREGWVNCDVSTLVKADLVFDLDEPPYLFESGSFCYILMEQVIEHVDSVPAVLAECWRIMEPGAVLEIHVPYAKADCYLWDVTHRHPFTEKSLNPFCTPEHFYSKEKFTLARAELTVLSDNMNQKLRNLIPFRRLLTCFLWGMFDGVEFTLVKPS